MKNTADASLCQMLAVNEGGIVVRSQIGQHVSSPIGQRDSASARA